MKAPTSLRELIAVPGFVVASALRGVFGDRYARVVVLRRRKKPPCVRTAVIAVGAATISAAVRYATYQSAAGGSTWSSSAGAFSARGATACA